MQEQRAVFSTRGGRRGRDASGSLEETLGMLQAYAAGVNQWIADVQSGSNGAV